MMAKQTYQVLFRNCSSLHFAPWDGPFWRQIPSLNIDQFRSESSDHHPKTQCKLVYDQERLRGIFCVEDRYVRCIREGFQAEVYKDSCVEFFIQPGERGPYFNFEFNCGGAMLATYVTDPTRVNGMLRECLPLSPGEDRMILRYPSLPAIVEPEIVEPITWFLEFVIPVAVLERYAGKRVDVSGRTWRGNFYKCANETSHPHWGAWAPVKELNFHAPDSFGNLRFGKMGMIEI